ncbi:hypothetical protein STENM223S_03900 [Streptomyces tendae]
MMFMEPMVPAGCDGSRGRHYPRPDGSHMFMPEQAG